MNYGKKMNRLEEAMRVHKITSKTLALRLGKKQNYITNLRKSYTSLSLSTLYEIAEVMDINPCELIVGFDDLTAEMLEDFCVKE